MLICSFMEVKAYETLPKPINIFENDLIKTYHTVNQNFNQSQLARKTLKTKHTDSQVNHKAI